MTANETQLDRPIFIMGAPRSGTTLLRNLLNRHPAIAICHETAFQHFVYRRSRAFGSLSDMRNRRHLVKEYLSTWRVQALQMDLQVLGETLLREGTSYAAFFSSLVRLYAQTHGKRRCGEKTPQHALLTKTLCEWYPNARMIHMLRDPRDVVASLLRMPWASSSVLTNANQWRQCNVSAWRSRRRQEYLPVRYEQLVTEPEQELRRVCAFVAEEYSPAMLVPNGASTPSGPWFRRADEPITTERLFKWREELKADQVALVEWVVGTHMQTFGYAAVGYSPTSLTILRGLASTACDAVARRVAQFPAAWYYLTRSTSLVKEETARRRYLKSIR